MSEPITTPAALPAETPATPDFTAVAMPGIAKQAAPKTTVIRAAQIKPCDIRIITSESGDTQQCQLVFVTPDGQEKHQDCTAQLFAAVEDQRLDQIDHSDFLVHVSEKIAVRVEPIRRQEFSFGLTPTDLEGVKLIAFLVNRTNGFATIKEYPAKVDREILIDMKRELDASTKIVVGQRLLGRFPIVDVREGAGDATVYVDPKAR